MYIWSDLMNQIWLYLGRSNSFFPGIDTDNFLVFFNFYKSAYIRTYAILDTPSVLKISVLAPCQDWSRSLYVTICYDSHDCHYTDKSDSLIFRLL